jgi:hypothetical protein
MKKTFICLTIILLTAQLSFAGDIKLISSRNQSSEFFGSAVAISGNFAIIGAYYNSEKGTSAGAAYIFEQTPSGWIEKHKFLPNHTNYHDFGWSVAISGHTAIVGAKRDHAQGSNTGAAYIYQYNGSEWSFKQKIYAKEPAGGAYFGCSVSICGNTAIIGSYNDNSKGAAFIFEKSANGWEQKTKLMSNDLATSDQFGWSVSIDGNTAIVGAYNKDSAKGAAYIFEKIDVEWQQIKSLKSPVENRAEFGKSVSISGDTVIVGAPYLNSQAGAAYIYEKNNNWQETKLLANDGAKDDKFGETVSIDGGTVIIGSYQEDGIVSNAGAAYLFERTDSGWTEKTKLVASDAANSDEFGYAVSISNETIIVGARYVDHNGNGNKGAAYIYSTNIQSPKISGYVLDTSNKPISNATITASNSIQSVETDINGYFEIPLYYNWSGDLTVSKEDYQFNNQGILSFDDVTDNLPERYFLIDAFTISGFITTPLGDPISGVKLTFTNNGGTAITNSDGYYSHKVLKNWTGEVFCEGRGLMYNPLRMFHKNISDNLYDQNFFGYRFTISGFCLDDNNNPVADVLIQAMPENIVFKTDANGYFEHDFDYEWKGSLIPMKSGVDFDPISRTYTTLTENQIFQNFDASPREYHVTGHIIDQDLQPLNNVQLCFGNQCEVFDGNYDIVLPFEWSDKVCPKKEGYWFSPACKEYTKLTVDTTQPYTATIHRYMVSGTITDADTGQPLEYVNLFTDNNQVSTDNSGKYQWEGRFGTQITLKPHLTGYVFEPETFPITSLKKHHPQVNFTARRVKLSISGTVKIGGSLPATEDVVIKCGDLGTTQTNEKGEYQCMVPYAWTGKIAAFMKNHITSPPFQEYGESQSQSVEPPVLNDKTLDFIAYESGDIVYQSILANCTHTVLPYSGGSTEINVWFSPENLIWTAQANHSWLTLSQQEETVLVTVAENPNYFPRSDIITIKANGSGVANSPQIIKIEQAAKPLPIVGPTWERDLDVTNYQHMQMIAANVMDDQGQTFCDENDMLAAFSGNDIRGVAHPIETTQGCCFFLQVWSNNPHDEEISFKLYDADQDRNNVNIKFPITFEANTSLGNIHSPHQLTVSDYFVRIKMNKGWNWFSINAYNKYDMSINFVLKSIGDKGTRIIGQDGFNEYASSDPDQLPYTPPKWYGSLSQISPLKMYKLLVNEPVYLEFSGNAIDLAATEIALSKGWNWIAYLPSEELPLNTALKSIGSNGVIISGQDGFAMYDELTGWVGCLPTLEPGKGYMLKMAIGDRLSYPSQTVSPRARTRRLRTIHPQTVINGWQVDQGNYQYQGAMTIALKPDTDIIPETGDALAAFAGSECRGVATPVNTSQGIRFFLQVWSNTPNETIRFRYYDASTDLTWNNYSNFTFEPDMVMGTITEPEMIGLFRFIMPEQQDDPLSDEIAACKQELMETKFDLALAQLSLTLAKNIVPPYIDLNPVQQEEFHIYRYKLDLEAGWHLISGTDNPTSLSTYPEGAIEVMYIYENGQYIPVTVIPAMKGVWIKLKEACELFYSSIPKQ